METKEIIENFLRHCKNKQLDTEDVDKAKKEVDELLDELDTPEWDEAFRYLAAH